MTLRYGAVLSSLRSMRGRTAIAEVAPTHAAVRYRTERVHGVTPLADLYLPEGATGGSVVLVHGGAFVIGSRRMKPIRYLAATLTAAGLAVCAIDYRMIFRGGRLAEATDDVHAGFEFWAARTAELGLDTRAISLVGLSAGASLALLAGARVEASRLAAIVSCFGLYELEALRGAASALPRLLFGTADRAAWRAGSPRFAAQPAALTVLLHGDEDGLVPVDQARRLAAHREALGLPTRLVIYPGAPHAFFNQPGAPAEAGVREILATLRGARPGAVRADPRYHGS